GLHHRGHATFDAVGVRVAENAAAGLLDRAREVREVLERMELRDVGEAQAGPALEGAERRALDQVHRAQARAPRGVELALERFALVAGGEEQVAVEALEV